MANIKSAKKRILVNSKKALRNKMTKSQTKTAIKKVVTAAATGDKALAQAALVKAISSIDRATIKGIYHRNTASRKISRLSKLVNKVNA
jgi:small subunit ribosomal protein S20